MNQESYPLHPKARQVSSRWAAVGGGLLLASCLTLLPLTSSLALGEDAVASAVARMSQDLQFLASDEQEGRNVGTEGIARAGDYVAARFAELGLETQLFDGTPFQEFTIPGPPVLGPAEHNQLSFTGSQLPDDLPELVLGENYTTLSLGSSGTFSGEVVFAGYGISAPDAGYDDYANIDVAGKVVIVLRKEPQQNMESSKLDGARNSQHAYFSSKEVNAALHQAAALILVNDRITAESNSGDTLLEPTGGGAALTENTIPTFFCSRSVVEPLILKATGKTLKELEIAIDETFEPRSQVLGGIEAAGETLVEESQIPVRNVIALLPGSGSLADEYVVVGAHYDHVGMGGAGSLAPGTVAIHNGADDNASGTTAMLEVARRLASDTAADRRGIVFMAFTAEEKGLLGSKHYIRNPRFPLEQTVAMLNMDMVGRLTGNSLTVYGTGTADGFDALIDRLNEQSQFALDKQAAGFGPSDHSSFYEVGIPVFHFFTGLHNEYHRPSDDVELIDVDGMARIAGLVTGVVTELSTQEQRPVALETSAIADVGRSLRRRAPRAIMGIQLDQTTEQVTVSAVTPQGPADRAGVQAGDIILKLADTDIETTEVLLQTLQQRKPNDLLPVTLQREGQTIEVEVKLGAG